jgi:hypothetical protein
LALAAAVSAPVASAKPRVSLTLPSTSNAGVSTPFSYATRGLAAASRVVLQRQQGTGRIWRTAVKLKRTKAGSASLRGLPLGRYQLRIAVLGSRNKVLAQRRRQLSVFGDVSFSKLFSSTGGVYTTPTGTFPYAMGFYASDTAFTVTTNPCRSVHIVFVAGPPGAGEDAQVATQTAIATLVQQSADPRSTTAAGNSVGTLDARIVPGQSWGLRLAQQGGTLLFRWYVNGMASCYDNDLTFDRG